MQLTTVILIALLAATSTLATPILGKKVTPRPNQLRPKYTPLRLGINRMRKQHMHPLTISRRRSLPDVTRPTHPDVHEQQMDKHQEDGDRDVRVDRHSLQYVAMKGLQDDERKHMGRTKHHQAGDVEGTLEVRQLNQMRKHPHIQYNSKGRRELLEIDELD